MKSMLVIEVYIKIIVDLPGISIFDNIIITQEVIHSMRGKNKQWMAIKIDLDTIGYVGISLTNLSKQLIYPQ